jgi:PAS domain S-box-containing protein
MLFITGWLLCVVPWISLADAPPPTKPDFLTPEERQWLSDNRSRIVVAIEKGYAPFLFVDDNNQPHGFAHDYLRRIEEKLGIHFVQKQFPSLDEILAQARAGEVHIVNAVTKTPAREDFLSFTEPFIQVPNVIVVHKDRQAQMNERDLAGLTVALVKSYGVSEYLSKRNIGFTSDLVLTDLAALMDVSFGRADAAVLDLATASFLISEKNITNLRVAGVVPFECRLAIGVVNTDPQLLPIIQKALSMITESERQEIRTHWLTSSHWHIYNERRFWIILAALAFVLTSASVVVLLWNWMLRRQIASRTEALNREHEVLQQSEEKFRNIVESSPAGMHLYRLETDGRLILTNANPSADRMLGILHGPLLGKTIEEAFPSLVATEIPGMYRAVAAGRLGPQSFEIPYKDKRINGIYDVRVFLTGKSTIAVTFTDISERKRIEEQLRQREKMDAIGQLAGGVAHDFNNQLAGILGFAELLADELADPTHIQYAKSITRAATRAAELTRQLLAFSRKGQFLSVPTDTHKTIAEVVSLLERSIDKRIAIKQDLGAEPAIVLADPAQLQSAILNLGLNARDAMPQGGTLTFSTRIMPIPGNRHEDHLPAGNYIRISIEDTGIGMDAATQKRLFEPFFTTKEVGKGTGLGLASAYGTVKNHGGTIRVYSEPGHGSQFDIYLPLYAGAGETVPVSIANESTPQKGSGRILIVDDEPVILELGAIMLHKHGYEVTKCLSPLEAIAFYRDNWQTIDLVILDMIMPEMGGRDLFKALLEINPAIKAVLASGFSLNGEAQAIMALGIRAFIQKPFSLQEITQTVNNLLQAKQSPSVG